MNGLPVVIRLIDPPLHEFLPSLEELLVEVTELRVRGDDPAELRRKEGQANAMPPDLRVSLLPQLKQAQRKYLDSQIKILDFLDERDRRGIARLQDEIGQIKRALDERQRSREELKKLLPD